MFLYCKFSSGFALFFTKNVKLPNDCLNLHFQGKKSSKSGLFALCFQLYNNSSISERKEKVDTLAPPAVGLHIKHMLYIYINI